MSGLTLAHRLDVHAHGDETMVGIATPRSPALDPLFEALPGGDFGIEPENLCLLLKRAGLQKVGEGNVDIAFPGTRYALHDKTGAPRKPQPETTPAAAPPPIEIPDN